MKTDDIMFRFGVGFASLFFVFGLSYVGAFGSRGIKKDYTFSYQNRPAIVQHEDIRFGPNQYQILLNDGDKVTVEFFPFTRVFISDDGKRIKCWDSGYSIENAD